MSSVAGFEDLPVLPVSNAAFHGAPDCGDRVVDGFVVFTPVASFLLLDGGQRVGADVPGVSDPLALGQDVFPPAQLECGNVVAGSSKGGGGSQEGSVLVAGELNAQALALPFPRIVRLACSLAVESRDVGAVHDRLAVGSDLLEADLTEGGGFVEEGSMRSLIFDRADWVTSKISAASSSVTLCRRSMRVATICMRRDSFSLGPLNVGGLH